MTSEKNARKQIFNKVKKIYLSTRSKQKFIPGVTKIPYAGRVYDERDMINLIDASLDFWLTAGRFARQFEKGLAGFLNTRHCALVNSGSSANLLAVSALTSPLLKERRLLSREKLNTLGLIQ